jgi:aldehyde:ferredoxin oxidoreductase
MPAGADPLGPDNLLGFVNGLLTGSGALFSGRWLVTGKSPLTGGWGDANCGGNLGPAIKQCGYDGIFFRGIASEPVYLYADGETVEIRSASHLWGTNATETGSILSESADGKKTPRVACIGEAGERLSLISGVCNDRGRIAARSGLGAVMGSKKLKAIVLNGNKLTSYADRAEIKHLSKSLSVFVPKENLKYPAWLLPLIAKDLYAGKKAKLTDGLLSLSAMRTWGTSAGNQVCVVTGDAPVRNWAGSSKEYGHRPIAPDVMAKRTIKKYRCYTCPLACGAISSMSDGFDETHRPEYETAMSLGPMLLNNDLDSLFLINELLNRAGMDSISAGAVVAFALECFEEGLLDLNDTDGLHLNWGNSEAIVALFKKMIAREGIGDLLVDGVQVAAQKIGNGAERFDMHSGGQELPMHDPKFDLVMISITSVSLLPAVIPSVLVWFTKLCGCGQKSVGRRKCRVRTRSASALKPM